ncbi:hypothetical protein C2869_16745 [Saccharobesus litoralis]|uniref:BIG2 domain-containing protein n=1 Tax=Saccharobesus litoralis TaxID=2172099 RepID=A0A2S0VUT5_9ALTE|nr:Ig-like domain-containing protein [Saccharobesus litoralis]AWB67968.1 hypothetical protein C2869_16745 [Saccharobesus litoralis]
MKTNLLNKLFTVTGIALALTACGEGEDYKTTYEPVEKITVSGDINLDLEEGTGIHNIDLLAGTNNPANTTVYTTKFTFDKYQLNEEGEQVRDDDGNLIPLFTGPDVPFSAIGKTGDILIFDADQLNDALVHEKTAAERKALIEEITAYNETVPEEDQKFVPPELYSEGIYNFNYELDNGSDELVKRNIQLKVRGVEDVLTDIEFNHPTGLTTNPGYPATVNALPVPANATYYEFKYSVDDTSIATINADTGKLTGVKLGKVNVTATSVKYPSIKKTIEAEVVPLEYPNGLEIRVAGAAANVAFVNAGESLQLEVIKLPEGETFVYNDDITFESLDPHRVSVDQNGLITGINYDLINENNANTIEVIASIPGLNGTLTKSINVTIAEHKTDYYASFNSAIELGLMDRFINKFWETATITSTMEATEAAAKDGKFGIHITSDGTKHTGISISGQNNPQVMGEGKGRKFKLSYDIKINNFDTHGKKPMRFYFVPQGSWDLRVERWHDPVKDGTWTHVEEVFDEKDWTGVANPGRLDLYMITGTEVDMYIDNLSLTVSE